jgi:hypothetical protein
MKLIPTCSLQLFFIASTTNALHISITGSIVEAKQTNLGSNCSLYAPRKKLSVAGERGFHLGLLSCSAKLEYTSPTSSLRLQDEVNSPFAFRRQAENTTTVFIDSDFFVYKPDNMQSAPMQASSLESPVNAADAPQGDGRLHEGTNSYIILDTLL